MDRSLGWEPPIDDPSNLIEATLSLRITELLEGSKAGLKVLNIDFVQSEYSQVETIVEVTIDDGQI